MTSDLHKLSSTAGYAEQAPGLFERYERYDPAELHRWLTGHLPPAPADVLDLGAGTGRDAAWFAGMGHRVVAVEPVRQMREGAQRLHPSALIEWVDDRLPDLPTLEDRQFDVLMLSAVWMHLDEAQREAGMRRLAALSRPGAVLAFMVRHGPVPEGRRMFEVSTEETVQQAAAHGFGQLRIEGEAPGRGTGAPEVTWSRLGFVATW